MKFRPGRIVPALTACLALTATALFAVPAEAREVRESGSSAMAASVARVGSYNVKGWHLTEPGGIDGRVRMRESLTRIEAKGLSIVGLQEFESPQADVVRNDGGWGLFRADANSVYAGGNYGGNAIMWKKSAWRLVNAWQLHAKVGDRRALHMPIVLLEHTSGKRVVVMNVHNPAGAENEAWREHLRDMERAKLRELKGFYNHVLFTGDFNENTEAVCFFTTNALMKAATGYKPNADGSCPASNYRTVDWIFGAGPVSFAGWEIDRTFEERNWSDHPLVSAAYTFG
ncbi:endonuclease/exonuclease/phosphatase family protein [Kribbella deserti]|uniref:Endonuclease/exonuclease/phosphatase family protein n=1 Tax=Kribbella deserti TaxID=1926257 RepID=A0ABV6QE38_9ACTN